MKWSVLWDLSVHNMSLTFDHTCCLDKSELETCQKNRNRKLRSASSFLFPLLPTVQFDVVHQHLDLRHKHKQHTNSCKQHVVNLHVPVFRLIGFIGFIRTLGMSASKGSSSSSFPISTSARDSPTVSMSSPIGAEFSLDLRAHCSAIPVSRLLTVLRRTMIRKVHIVGLGRFHFSTQVEIEKVVFEIDWNEIILSMPIHQFLKKNSHSLTNFTVNWNHVTTVMSKVEILSSFVRDFRSTAQNFVCTSESSIHGSEQSVLIVSLELPSSTVRNPVTTGSPTESSVSCSFWTKVQWECVHCSSCVQVHLRPTEPRRTIGGTDIQTSKRK